MNSKSRVVGVGLVIVGVLLILAGGGWYLGAGSTPAPFVIPLMIAAGISAAVSAAKA